MKPPICPKRAVKCTNQFCTAEMPEPLIAAHKANDCPWQIVACPFSSVGCNERMLRRDADNHEEASMKQHNRLLLQSLQQHNESIHLQNESIQSLQEDNASLWQNTQEHMEAHQSLKNKVAEQEERLDSQEERADNQSESLQSLRTAALSNAALRNAELRNANENVEKLRQLLVPTIAEHGKMLKAQQVEIVFKVRVADLIGTGGIVKWSERKAVGAYNAQLHVEKGYPGNADSCGIVLHLTDGPFPCQVSYTFEVVSWDGKPESACQHAYSEKFMKAEARGKTKFILLSKLTAAASPYVNNGTVNNGAVNSGTNAHVTFISTFRIISS